MKTILLPLRNVLYCINFIVLILHVGASYAAIDLAMEVTSNPVQPSEIVNVAITVSNTGSSTSGVLRLQLLYPQNMLRVHESEISDNGDCPNTSCDPGQFVTWDLGTMPPGTARTVTLPSRVYYLTPDGTEIAFNAEVFENDISTVSISQGTIVNANPVFDITVDEDINPVAPGDTLSYTIKYANRGLSAATNVQLTIPLPAGVSFVEATNGGVFNGSTVNWNLGTLSSRQDGRVRVTVTVNNSIPAGTILVANAAMISGQVNFAMHAAQAIAATRVENSIPLSLAMDIDHDPVEPGEYLGVSFTASNISSATLAGVSLQLHYPEYLARLAERTISDAGNCSSGSQGSCDPGQLLTWNLGTMPPGSARTVSLQAGVPSSVPEGTLLTFDAKVSENSGREALASHSTVVDNSRVFDIVVDNTTNPIAPGNKLKYSIIYSNRGTISTTNTQLRFPLPSGVSFISATQGAVFSDGVLAWDLNTLPGGQTDNKQVTVQVNSGTPVGTILKVDPAEISGQINGLWYTASALATTRVENNVPLMLVMEASPDPVQVGRTQKTLNTKLTVSNVSNSALSGVNLQWRYPEQAPPTSKKDISDEGYCPELCDVVGLVTWDLGTIAPGLGRSVTIPSRVYSPPPDRNLIPFTAKVSDNGNRETLISRSVIADTEPLFEISVNESIDPVTPGQILTYTISYSNRSTHSATNTLLDFPLPNGVTFISATGGGIFNGSSVNWPINDLSGLQNGREQVTVSVDNNVPLGTILKVDAATIGGEVNWLQYSANALAATRVEDNIPLLLTMDLGPDPVTPSGLMNANITASNVGGAPAVDTVLHLRIPEDLLPIFDLDGGTCPSGLGTCNPNEWGTWRLGNIPRGSAKTITLPIIGNYTIVDGGLMMIEAEASEVSGREILSSHSVVVDANPVFSIEVNESLDPVAPGGTEVYTLNYGNRSALDAESVQLRFPLPAGTTLISATNCAVTVGNTVTWDLGTLSAGQGGTQEVVIAVNAGVAAGTALIIDTASISGKVNLEQHSARALTTTHVANTSLLSLTVQTDSDAVQAHDAIGTTLSVENISNTNVYGVNLHLRYPDYLSSLSETSISDGGDCSRGPHDITCDEGESVIWNLGIMPPGSTKMVTLSPRVYAGTPDGTLINFDARVKEDGGTQALASNSVLVGQYGSNTCGALPPIPILISPNGAISDTLPTYSWNPVSGADDYQLWVTDATGDVITTWYDANVLGCAGGSGTCSISPAATLATGDVDWWVKARNSSGEGPFSAKMEFSVTGPPPVPAPDAATLVSPHNSVATGAPTYSWNAVADASDYHLQVDDASGTPILQWYTAAEAGCDGGTGTCSVTPTTTVSGNAQWWVRTWNSSGNGPWSDGMEFFVAGTVAPGAATPLTPNGNGTDTTPTYTWDAVTGATWYYLWVSDATGSPIKQWYSAAEVGCADGTGTCSVTPSTEVKGDIQWWLQTWNDYGTGPWSDTQTFSVTGDAPAAPSLIAPVAEIPGTLPTYSWDSSSNATWYYLWVQDATGTPIKNWYSATDANCEGGGTCTVTPSLEVKGDNIQWWVQAWNTFGTSDWSAAGTFSEPGGKPSVPTPLTPSGNASTLPTYTWSADPRATWFYLWVDDSSGNRIKEWYTAADASCADGTGTCSITPSVPVEGSGQWWLEAYNGYGTSNWSSGMTFTVTVSR